MKNYIDRWLDYTKNGKKGLLPIITKQEIEQIKLDNHVVKVYPRKKQACVDGSKYFRIVG